MSRICRFCQTLIKSVFFDAWSSSSSLGFHASDVERALICPLWYIPVQYGSKQKRSCAWWSSFYHGHVNNLQAISQYKLYEILDVLCQLHQECSSLILICRTSRCKSSPTRSEPSSCLPRGAHAFRRKQQRRSLSNFGPIHLWQLRLPNSLMSLSISLNKKLTINH